MLLIVLLRREALEITFRTAEWAQIPVSVFVTALSIFSEVDKTPFEVAVEDFTIYGGMGIRSPKPPEGKSAASDNRGLLKSCPSRKPALDRVVLWMFSSRILEKKSIFLDDIHISVKLIYRAVINFRYPTKSNAAA